MKSLLIFVALVFSIQILFAQTDTPVEPENQPIDTSFKTAHMIGLNVFPAFGILGGGVVNNSKIALQYKVMTPKLNFKMSLNYLNYFRNRNGFDIVGIVPDTTLPVAPATDTIFQSMRFRGYYNQVNTYDFRAGIEYAFDREDIRFYLGAAGIIGVHNIVNTYHHYNNPFTGYPIENVGFPYTVFPNTGRSKMRVTNFMKAGFDLALGVDFKVADNCVVALQYTPEFAYYKNMKETVYEDVDDIYGSKLDNFWVFTPDFIDLIIYIKF